MKENHKNETIMSDWSVKELELIRKNEEINNKSKQQSSSSSPSSSAEWKEVKTAVPRHDEYAAVLQKADLIFGLERTATKIPVKVQKHHPKLQSSQVLLTELNKCKSASSALQEEVESSRHEIRQLKAKLKSSSSKPLSEVSSQEREKEFQMSVLAKENQDLRDEMRTREAAFKAETVRIDRQAEEIGRLRTEKQQLSETIKELRDKHLSSEAELKGKTKSLEKQLKQLLEAFKKQMELIHVLKQQKLHLEACQVLNFTKEEFLNSVDWQPISEENTK